MLNDGTTKKERAAGWKLPAVAFATAFLSTWVGFALGNRWLLPALNALAIYPFYLELILARRRRSAIVLACLWAVFASQATIAATLVFPERAEEVVMRGSQYRDEMFSWVATGEGKESSPSQFIPEHIRDFGAFAVLAVATGGFGALFLGAVLLNYMNFYVGALTLEAAHPVWTLVFGWQPYAAIRVVGYIIVATALSEAFLGVVTRFRAEWRTVFRMTGLGLALVLADIFVKWLVAPPWSKLLKATSGIGV